MGARLNRSLGSVVVWCTSCTDWSESASSVARGHDTAVGHEKVNHPGLRSAYMNRAKYLERLQK
jgi:hypothetical protein